MKDLIVINDRCCPNCGGDLHGDGYITPVHCERISLVNQTDEVTGRTHSVSDTIHCTEAHS